MSISAMTQRMTRSISRSPPPGHLPWLYYFEEGMGFVGEAEYEVEGFYSDEYFSHENDPEEYEERARDEWGWEPYEEPEPLTEWYEQGVKDKGLA